MFIRDLSEVFEIESKRQPRRLKSQAGREIQIGGLLSVLSDLIL